MEIFLECAILSVGIIITSFLNLCCFLSPTTTVAGVLPAGGRLPFFLCPPTGGTYLSFTSHSLTTLITRLPAICTPLPSLLYPHSLSTQQKALILCLTALKNFSLPSSMFLIKLPTWLLAPPSLSSPISVLQMRWAYSFSGARCCSLPLSPLDICLCCFISPKCCFFHTFCLRILLL